MKTSKEKVRIPALFPLGMEILTLLVGSILAVYWLQKKNIEAETHQSLETVQSFFQGSLEQDAQLLNGLLNFIEKDKNLQNQWLNKDRDHLLHFATPVFEEIRSKYDVTHFYFHDLDKFCFLRVHQPSRFGDYIDRFTLKEAVQQSNLAWGIELGPLGTFTLRVVHPWFIDGELVGYIELGKEIEYIMPMLKKYVGVELVFIINKSFLNRQNWEEGMKMMGRRANWDLLPDFVVMDSTIRDIPRQLGNSIILSHSLHQDTLYILPIENRIYQNGFIRLFDAGGREVGDIIVLKNITTSRMQLQTLSLMLIAFCIIIATTTLGLFHLYISRLELKLTAAHNNLNNEIERCKEIEIELREHRKHPKDSEQKKPQELQKTI